MKVWIARGVLGILGGFFTGVMVRCFVGMFQEILKDPKILLVSMIGLGAFVTMKSIVQWALENAKEK